MKKIILILILLSFSPSSTHATENLASVAVIGAGSAGLGASFVTSSKKHRTILFQGEVFRGDLNYEKPVKNWLGAPLTPGKEIMERVEAQSVDKGTRIISDPITSVDFSQYPYFLKTASGAEFHALSIIIASGTSHTKLDLPSAKEYEGKGLLYDVAKHDPTWHKKRIVVIGSGDDAISKATRLAANAPEVTILVRSDSFKASLDEVDALLSKNKHVQALFSKEVTEIVGDGEKITGVKTKDQNIDCDIVVVAIGRQPNSALFAPYVDCDEEGYILLEPFSQQTSCKGVYAAGSVTDKKYVQAMISCSDGMKAGYDASKYIESKYLERIDQK